MNSTQRMRSSRRGVTLLFVISMIVLFLLMGTAFVIVSNDYLQSAKRRSTIDARTDNGADLLERSVFTLLRGAPLQNHTSQMRGHSILGDQYGYGFTATVATNIAAVPQTGGQFWQLSLNGAANMFDTTPPTAVTFNHSEHNGKLLSFTNGEGIGITTRIINQEGNLFVVTPVFNDDASALADVAVGDQVVVNGREYSSTGIGAGLVNSPNRVRTGNTGDPLNAYLAGTNRPNEAYDAPDAENMWLGGFNGEVDPTNIIASFHNRMGLAAGQVGEFRPSVALGTANAAYPYGGVGLDIDNTGDGFNDSVLIDIGLPIQTDSNGRYIKPLAAVRVLDMDGRVNANVHGSPTQLADMITTRNPFLSTVSRPAGGGYGPAEITLTNSLSAVSAMRLMQGDGVFEGRYGTDNQPGIVGRDAWSQQKLFGHARGPLAANSGTVGSLFQSSAMDLHGRLRYGSPLASSFPSLNFNQAINGLPEIDMVASGLADEAVESPYEIDLFGITGADEPFTPLEMSAVLRRFDADSNLLPARLRTLLDTDLNSAANNLTTESWETPVANQFVPDLLRTQLLSGGNAALVADPDALLVEIEEMLAPEVLKGLRMNVNRPFGNGIDDDGVAGVDNPGEHSLNQTFGADTHPMHAQVALDFANDGITGNNVVTNADINTFDGANRLAGDFYQSRYEFAKNLYVLTLLVTNDGQSLALTQRNQYRASIARWCATVVDARDPDVIMTPFEFDLNPWDGWQVDGDIVSTEFGADGMTVASAVVWGTERPEMLLTEAVATHDRRTENLAVGGGEFDPADPAGSDDATFDQRLMPNTSAHIELYNPWTQGTNNQIFSPALYDANGVDLDGVSAPGNPIWRIMVKRERVAGGGVNEDRLRAIYFTNPTALNAFHVANGIEAFHSTRNVSSLPPGQHAVIGGGIETAPNSGIFRTTFGRTTTASEATEATFELATTRNILLDTNTNVVSRFDPAANNPFWFGGTMSSTRAVAVAINSPRSLSLSDPPGGYPSTPALGMAIADGFSYIAPFGTPLDDGVDANRDAVDLAAVWANGTSERFRELSLERLADPTRPWNQVTNPYISVDSLQADLTAFNGLENDPNNDNMRGGMVIDPGVPGIPVLDKRTNFRTNERGESATNINDIDFRAIWNRQENIVAAPTSQPNAAGPNDGGNHNFAFHFTESLGRLNSAYQPQNIAVNGFTSINWYNRPYSSHLELMNVPFASMSPDGQPGTDLNETYSLNNAADEYSPPTLFPLGARYGHLLNFFSDQSNLFQLMDYIEVPSRFVGVERFLRPSTFVGKTPTTFTNQLQIGYNPPFNIVSNFRVPGKINLNTIYSEDVWDDLMGDYNSTVTWDQFRASRDANYFFPSDDVATTLFRENAAGTDPMFDFDGTTRGFNGVRHSQFRYDMRQRLANMTTTRSSVFSIWITVAYFEVDEGGLIGAEVGSETGEIRRDRGFYMVDRSIPVAFEPGKNHNVDRSILVRAILD